MISFILACTPSFPLDITEAPSYAWPRVLLGSKEVDGSERDSKIFLEIMVAFVRSKCMKLIRHSSIWGSFGEDWSTNLKHKDKISWFESGSVLSSAMIVKGRSLVLNSAVSLSLIFDAYFYNLTSSRMVEVEKLCKEILFIINLGRIKQITSDKCSSKGGGLQPPQPLPWIRPWDWVFSLGFFP